MSTATAEASSTKNPARPREFEFVLPIGYMDREGQIQRNGGRLVTELLHSCIVGLGTLTRNGTSPISGMYSVDRNFLLLKLRSITFGPELKASYTCPTCSETTKLTEDIDELPVRSLAEGESAEEIGIQLEDGYVDRDGQTHTTLKLRLPTGNEEEAVASQVRQNASEGKNALLARCMKSLGDIPPHRLEAQGTHILSELTMTDRRLIDRTLSQAAPGINLVRNIECASCGNAFATTLDL